MKLLALDSSTEACSVALAVNGCVQERFEIAPRKHTQLMLPMAYGLLADAGIALEDLDGLAFAQGPGSFTGLRIGVGTVQGLALGLACPVIGVSTLAVLAARCMRRGNARQVAVAMDARMNQVYWGEYVLDPSGQCQALTDDSLRDPGQVTRLEDGVWHAAGMGWQRYASELRQASGLEPDITTIECYPHAEDVAYLALARMRSEPDSTAATALPIYLRQQVAVKMKPATP